MGIWSTLLWVVSILCAVWVILQVWTKHKHWTPLKKIVWTILAIIPGLAILTAIVFYFMEYKK